MQQTRGDMTMRLLISSVFLLASSPSVSGQEQIPTDILKEIKSATAFVKVRIAFAEATGTGFLIKGEDGGIYVATNQHVVSPLSTNSSPAVRRLSKQIEVVFNSGQKGERTILADIACADPVIDLALLRLRDVNDLPKPLDHSAKLELIETMPVYIFGFPFGKDLSESRHNPTVTVSRGSVSSLRMDENGQQKRVQIDGDMNPGNSGGPIVDAKGRVVGISVAKISGTNIGMAIPAQEINRMFDGRPVNLEISPIRLADGTAEFGLSVDLVDPLKKITAITVHYTPTAGLKGFTAVFDKEKGWPAIPSAVSIPLTLTEQKATGALKIPMSNQSSIQYMFQTGCSLSDKKERLSKPLVLNVPRPKSEIVERTNRPTILVERGEIDPKGAETTSAPLPKRDMPDRRRPRDTEVELDPQTIEVVRSQSVSVGAGPEGGAVAWAPNADSFYFQELAGTLRRFSFPDLQELVKAGSPSGGRWLSYSSLGPVQLALGDRSKDVKGDKKNLDPFDILLRDPNTLKVTKSIPVPLTTRVVTSPKSIFAYAVMSGDSRSDTVFSIDLSKGVVSSTYRASDLGQRSLTLDHMTMSPDGRWLFTCDDRQLFRFRAEGATITMDDFITLAPALKPNALAHSLDSRLIHAFRFQATSREIPTGRAPVPSDVFAAESLSKPAFTVTSRSLYGARAFGTSELFVISPRNAGTIVEVFDFKGAKVASYDLAKVLDSQAVIKHMLAHPSGRHLILVVDNRDRKTQKLITVQLPAK